MLASDRRDEIIQMLSVEGSVIVSKLTKKFEVSIETIRRDLEALEKEGLLKRVYGGAVLKSNKSNNLNYAKRKEEFIDEKIEIAQKAISYIEEGSFIALNNSTTNLEIAKLLREKFNELTIVTNSLNIVNELVNKESFTIILVGGVLNSREYAFNGQFTEEMLSNFVVNKSFISVSGVSLSRGITDYLMGEIDIQKKFMKISQEVIILAISSNIDNESLVKIADVEDVNLVITDSKLNKKIADKYLKSGIEII
ncbi:MAG: DeoR/GlpR family DNA-binding transcription regulator [Clostridium sp.]|nr:DeoR/GlpR family DNA-binding transcription regulator [Clostridium sp.]MDU7083189.1 DeoR/GlpR family DNA-binding transcription regulator [Clostridium sp.]